MRIRTVILKEINLLLKTGKTFIVPLAILYTVCKGLSPFVLLQISKVVLDALAQRIPAQRVVFFVAMHSLLALILFCMSQQCKRIFNAEFNDLRQKSILTLNDIYLKINYETLEDAMFQQKAFSAKRAVSGPTGIEGMCSCFVEMCPEFFTLLLYLASLSRFHTFLGLFCMTCTMAAIWINCRARHLMKQLEDVKSPIEKQEDAFTRISHNLSAGKDIRLFSMAAALDKEFEKLSCEIVRNCRKTEKALFWIKSISAVITLCRDFLCFLLIARAYQRQTFSTGDVAICIGYIFSLSTIVERVVSLSGEWSKSIANAQQYFLFLDQYGQCNLDQDRKKIASIPNGESIQIAFCDVSFRYTETEKWIIRHFSFVIEAGQALALVGENGAGKSTLIKLVAGLLRPTEGEIRINGVPASNFEPSEYRQLFSAVFQETNLYAMTILENVIGKDVDNNSRKRGIDCLIKVGLKTKIESLPLKYDTPVLRVFYENGTEFSGGEKQRIAIARALYKNADVVLLDEPTASIDVKGESEIYEAFHQLSEGKTAIYVSHRLSSTRFCDHILMLKADGEIEYGTHEELLAQKGDYYSMFETQGRYYQ